MLATKLKAVLTVVPVVYQTLTFSAIFKFQFQISLILHTFNARGPLQRDNLFLALPPIKLNKICTPPPPKKKKKFTK